MTNEAQHPKSNPRFSDEVMGVVVDMAHRENELRELGANKQRISSAIIPYVIELARLATRGDETAQLATYDMLEKDESNPTEEESSEEEWIEVDRLVDTAGFTYEEARRIIIGRR